MLVIFLMLVTAEQNRVAQVTETMEYEPAALLLGRRVAVTSHGPCMKECGAFSCKQPRNLGNISCVVSTQIPTHPFLALGVPGC